MPCPLLSDVHCLMHVMVSNPFTAVCSMVCMRAVIPLTRNSVNQLVLSVKSWVSITRMVINRFTTRWCEWHRSFLYVILWWMGKGISVQSTATHLQQCDIQRVVSIESPNTCLKILKRKQLISNRISTIRRWNQPFCPHDSPTFSSMVRMVSLSVWRQEFLHTT